MNIMLLKAIFAFLALPGIVAFVLPLIIASFDLWRNDIWYSGVLILFIGILVLLMCVIEFYRIGKGTLAPWEPPEKLVTSGLYRYSRNPMYIGVLLIICGWCSIFLSPLLLIYVFVIAVVFHLRVVYYEEPWQKETFNKEWDDYKEKTPRWIV